MDPYSVIVPDRDLVPGSRTACGLEIGGFHGRVAASGHPGRRGPPLNRLTEDQGLRSDIEPSVELVRRLVRELFPQWAHLAVTEVSSQGWDNRTFRLGRQLSVRLPSGDGYAGQVDREHRWLPVLGRALKTPIPSPVAKGAPSPDFPWAWSVYRWLDGTPLDEAETVDLVGVAADVAAFLRSLQQVRVHPDAPAPATSNGFRGDPFGRYLAEGQAALSALDRPLRQQALQWLEAATHST
jgi:aminoglycoside phosphotransferase (APT) family kinase protein